MWPLIRGVLAFIGALYLLAAIICTTSGGGVLFIEDEKAFNSVKDMQADGFFCVID